MKREDNVSSTTKAYVEIKDIDELLKLCSAVDRELIINAEIGSIEIYDGYRE
jgi:hypothetical protein